MEWTAFFRRTGSSLVGLRHRGPGPDPHHHRRGHGVPAPPPGAPCARPASGRESFLPAVAVADDRHGDAGSGPRSTASTMRRSRPRRIRTARRCWASTACCGVACSCTSRRAATGKPSSATATARPTTGSSAHVYSSYLKLGLTLMGLADVILFGIVPGALIFLTQIAWIPFWAAGVINGIGHYLGLPQLVHRGRQHQHRAVGHPDRRRGTAQQPSRLHDLGQAVEQVVRVRYRLDVHPHARSAGAREGQARRAGAAIHRAPADPGPADAASGDYPPLRCHGAVRQIAEAHLRRSARRAAAHRAPGCARAAGCRRLAATRRCASCARPIE